MRFRRAAAPRLVRAGVQVGRRARAQVRRARWRPRSHLHAARAAGHHRDARVCASRRRALGGVRRLRGQRARHTRSARQSALTCTTRCSQLRSNVSQTI